MRGRKLALRREALAELTTNEMSVVAGAQQLPPWTPVIHTLPLDRCLNTIVNCLVATVGC